MEGISVRDGKYSNFTEAGARFNACLTDCIKQKLPMIVPGGSYDFHTPLIVPSGFGTRILGTGWRAELNAMPGFNDYVIKFDSSKGDIRGFEISNLTINGNCKEQSSGGGILASGAVESWFTKLHLFGCYNEAIKLDGISAGGFGHHNELSSSLIDGGTASPGLGIGLVVFASDENVITTTRFQDLGGADAFAAGLEVGAIIDRSGLQVYDKINIVNGADGLRVKDTGRVRIIGGCNFDGPRGTALIISGDRCLVEGAQFLEGKEGRSYIHMNNGTGNIIHTNGFQAPDSAKMRSFIRESGGSHNNMVNTNTLYYQDAQLSVGALERNKPRTGKWKDNIVYRS